MDAVEVAFQSIDALGPEAAELRQPFIDFLERLGFDSVEAALRIHRGFDEAGVAEHPQVLGDGWLRHAQPTLDFANGLLVRGKKTEDGAPVGLGNDGEGRFHVSVYTSTGIYMSRHIKEIFAGAAGTHAFSAGLGAGWGVDCPEPCTPG